MSGEEENDDRRKANERVWEQRGDDAFDRLTHKPKRTIFAWVIGLCVVALLLSALFGAFSFVNDWGSQPKRIYGVENVRKTWSEAYRLDRSATEEARTICATAQASGLGDTVSGPAILAQVSRYNGIWSDYSQVVSNKLEGGRVLPHDLPSKNKTLAERLKDPDVGCPDDVIAKIPGATMAPG